MDQPDTSPGEAAASCADDLKGRTEQFAREEPLQAVGIAFATGLVLTLLPIGGIIAVLVRLALSLARPALVVLGAVKLYEEVSRRQKF